MSEDTRKKEMAEAIRAARERYGRKASKAWIEGFEKSLWERSKPEPALNREDWDTIIASALFLLLIFLLS